MIRKIILALVCLLAPAIAHAQVSVVGNLKDAGIANVTGSNSYVRFTLENYGANIPRVTSSNVVAVPYKDFPPDGSGNISGTLQGNDTILPSQTFYQVCIYYQGQQFRCATYYIGGTAFNLNSATPLVTNPTPQNNILTAKTFEFSQGTPATTWTIPHNFGDKNVLFNCYDLTGTYLLPEAVVETNTNTLTVTFPTAQAGSCTLMNAANVSTQPAAANVVVTNPTGTQTLDPHPFVLQGTVTAQAGGEFDGSYAGNPTFTGNPTFLGNVTLATILANPIFSGNPVFSGSPSFTGTGNIGNLDLGTTALSSPHTWSATQTFTGAQIASNFNSTLYMGNPTYALTDAGFSAAITALPAGGTLRITSGQTVVLTSSHTISNQISILCDPGAGFSYPAAAGTFIQFNGANSVLDGCTLKGQGSSTAQQAVVINANFVRVTHNAISNFGSSSGNGTVEVGAGNGFVIDDNLMQSNLDFDIFVNNTTASQILQGFDISRNIAQRIIVHSSGASAQNSHFRIQNNNLTAEANSNVEFCVEVQSLGSSTAPAWGDITGNVCELAANGGDGGFSVMGTEMKVADNIFNSSGFTFTISGLEIVLCNFCNVTGNVLNNGVGGDGLILDRASTTIASHNTISGFKTGASDYGIHLIVANTTGPTANGDIISDNDIQFPTGGTGIGIWHECNAAGATCQFNSIHDNSIFSDGTSGSIGIKWENDVGTSSGETQGTNTMKSPATAVSVVSTTFSKVVQSGTKALTGGTGSVALPEPYDSGLAPLCNATDTTAANAAAASSTSTTLTLTGTGTDTLAWRCFVE